MHQTDKIQHTVVGLYAATGLLIGVATNIYWGAAAYIIGALFKEFVFDPLTGGVKDIRDSWATVKGILLIIGPYALYDVWNGG